MLKPIVLNFSDDIPRSQFWLGFSTDFFFVGGEAFTFRVPEHLGKAAAVKRLSLVFDKPEEDIIVIPAPPTSIMLWLEDHKKEAQFRVKK